LDAPITASEIESVIAKLQNNKAAGVDTISADLGNPNITYYNEGARAVGLKIKKIINKKEIEHVRVK
jgi:hypothetical protein